MKSKILLIDDEPDFTDMIRMRLESDGYSVEVANTGVTGLAKASSSRVGLVLLDIMMPEMDGLEVLRQLRSDTRTRSIPVVMLTARSESSSIFKAEELGMTDYLIKPCDSAALLQTVRRYAR